MNAIEQKLMDLGYPLPVPPKPVASYVPFVRSVNHVVVSGQLPFRQGELIATGCVPSEVSVEQAAEAAAQCAVNGLAILNVALEGEWDRLVRIVRVGVFVLSANGFNHQPQVANGASNLLADVLGDRGCHARVAVGVNALPLNASVEVEMLAEATPWS